MTVTGVDDVVEDVVVAFQMPHSVDAAVVDVVVVMLGT